MLIECLRGGERALLASSPLYKSVANRQTGKPDGQRCCLPSPPKTHRQTGKLGSCNELRSAPRVSFPPRRQTEFQFAACSPKKRATGKLKIGFSIGIVEIDRKGRR